MAVVLYGDIGETQGSGVYLNVLRINSYKREAVFNGPDYLYTRHTLSVRATFNPGTQKDELTGKKNAWRDAPPHTLPAIPVARESLGPLLSHKIAPHAGNPDYTKPAVYTVEAVKHHLMQPRLQLQWAWDNVNVLLSPMPGMRTDETNGPTPISVDVVEFHSGKTMMVDWVVRTDVNECPAFGKTPWPVLSHQYGQRHNIDNDFLATVTTRGTVVFSASVLHTPDVGGTGTFTADDFRHLIFLPVPANFKRETIQTDVSPDGLTVEYEVVDKERFLNWGRAGITRIVGVHVVTNELPNMSAEVPGLRIKLDLASIAARLNAGRAVKERAIDRIPFAPDWLKETDKWLTAFVDTTAVGKLLAEGWGGLLAKSTHVVRVQAWVNRSTPRNDAEDFIRDIISQRILPANTGGLPLISLKSTIEHSIEGNTVNAEEWFVGGPLGPIGSRLPSKTPILGQRIFGSDDRTGALITDDETTVIPGPPNDSGSRGTYTQKMVSSALSRPCDPGANLPPDAPAGTNKANLTAPTPPAWPRPVGG